MRVSVVKQSCEFWSRSFESEIEFRCNEDIVEQRQEKLSITQKTFAFKRRTFNALNQKLRKHQKKANKKLELFNKGGTFAPATANKFFNKWSEWGSGNRSLLKEKRGRKLF